MRHLAETLLQAREDRGWLVHAALLIDRLGLGFKGALGCLVSIVCLNTNEWKAKREKLVNADYESENEATNEQPESIKQKHMQRRRRLIVYVNGACRRVEEGCFHGEDRRQLAVIHAAHVVSEQHVLPRRRRGPRIVRLEVNHGHHVHRDLRPRVRGDGWLFLNETTVSTYRNKHTT